MMKIILPLLFCSILLFNSCERCDYINLRPQVVAYLEILDKNTNADLVLGNNPTLQLSDIQVIHVKGDERQTETIVKTLPEPRADSLLTVGFVINLPSPDLPGLEYPDTTFISYSGIYPQDTFLIEYWHSDNDCEGRDDYPDNFSLKLNGQSLCEACFAETITISK